jgi:hypothetical protein
MTLSDELFEAYDKKRAHSEQVGEGQLLTVIQLDAQPAPKPEPTMHKSPAKQQHDYERFEDHKQEQQPDEPQDQEDLTVALYLSVERDKLEATAHHDELQSKGEVIATITAFGGGDRGIEPGVVMRDPKRRHVDPVLRKYDYESD